MHPFFLYGFGSPLKQFLNTVMIDARGVLIAPAGIIPSWDTAGRPSIPGIVGYNFDTGALEGFDGTSWH